jgi:hypothetical protein
MEHEIRYYLRQIKAAMAQPTDDEIEDGCEPFKPSYLVTAVKLPTGAIELAVNTENIEAKIDYILETYDGDMCHKLDRDVVMQNIMVV